MNASIRDQFPALERMVNGHDVIYLDGPAGTQVPIQVIDAISSYYKRSNANTHGHFAASVETDQIMQTCREQMAKFLSAENADCISLGANMTSLNYSLAVAIGRYLQPGDEILITQLDHEANRGPWLSLQEKGIVVKEIPLLPSTDLDYDSLAQLMNPRVKLVAVGLASNFCGTINDVDLVRRLCDQVGAWMLLDAVHYAPHLKIDVQQLDCDFLLCSGYKFYGPHVGILYTKSGLLDELEPNRLRTQEQHAPYRIETGTLNHAAFAGLLAALHFMEGLDETRDNYKTVFKRIQEHEMSLAKQLYDGLNEMGVTIIGKDFTAPRTPTLAITIDDLSPSKICQELGQVGIYAWDGHFYALRASEVLGLEERGGVTRLGISIYTNEAEVKRTLEVIRNIAHFD